MRVSTVSTAYQGRDQWRGEGTLHLPWPRLPTVIKTFASIKTTKYRYERVNIVHLIVELIIL